MPLSVVGAGGGGGGGVPPELSIGAVYTSFGNLPNDSNLTLTVSLDTGGNAAEIYRHGLTVNAGKDGFLVGTKGRYAVTVSSFVDQDATNWCVINLSADATPFAALMADPTSLIVPPRSVINPGAPSIVYFSYVELDVGGLIQFYANQSLARSGTPLVARDIYCQVQYVGLATSI